MPKLIPKAYVFWISIAVEIISLFLLRSIGIDWDYHIDAVTYVEKSEIISKYLLQENSFFAFLNNGYYFLVYILKSKPVTIISLNIFLYSFTNYLIVLLMRPFAHRFYSSFEYLILFNPYRVYLGTTLLKDTLICFLLILTYYSFNLLKVKNLFSKVSIKTNNILRKTFFLFVSLMSSIGLLFLALRSAFYLLLITRVFDNPKKIKSLILLVLLLLFINNYFEGNIFNSFKDASSVNMDFRDYGSVANFSSFGNFGFLIRMILWPIFFVSGIFFVFSPSLELLLISFGIFLIFFIFLKLRSLPFLVISFLNFAFFAGITSGFLSYARYSLPTWLLSSIIIYIKKRPDYLHQNNEN